MKNTYVKRLLCSVMVICLAGSMSACGGEKKEPEKEATTQEEQDTGNSDKSGDTKKALDAESETIKSLAGVGIKLEEVGTVKDQSQDIYFQDNALLKVKSEKEAELLNYLGEKATDKTYKGVNYLGNGIYEVSDASSKEANSVGLVNKEGEEILPCEAAKLEFLAGNGDILSDRYLRVIYTTGETKNEEEAILYSTDNMFSIAPDEGDTLYTGYIQIYDLEKKQFIPDFKSTNGSQYSLVPCGDNIIYEDENGTKTLLNAEGKELQKMEASGASVGKTTYFYEDNGISRICDAQGNQLYETQNYIHVVDGTDYYTANDGENTTLITKEGASVLNLGGGDVYEIHENVVKVYKDDKYSLFTLDGEEIYAAPNSDININYLGRGYWTVEESEGNYQIFTETGECGKTTSAALSNYIEDGDKYKVYIFNDGDYTLSVDSTSYTDFGNDMPLITVQNNEGKVALYDTITGEQLLDYKYTKIEYAAGCVYAYADGKYTVYEVTDAQ